MEWTVLTGDIVGSSGLKPERLDQVMELLDSIAWELSGWRFDEGPSPETAFARRAGDSWQMAINQPKFSLRSALYVIARLRASQPKLFTRIAVATGTGSLPDDPDDLNSAHGEVFVLSGRKLERMNNEELLAFAGKGAMRACFALADQISQGWTKAQASSLSLVIPPGAGPRRVAAKQLGISRQAVDQALHAAGFPALEAAMTALEAE